MYHRQFARETTDNNTIEDNVEQAIDNVNPLFLTSLFGSGEMANRYLEHCFVEEMSSV